MRNAVSRSTTRYPWVDLLRFVAAASVVVYHFKSVYVATLAPGSILASEVYTITKFGYLGVDLFFLISGFVILLSASDRGAVKFAIARFLRVFPTLWVCASLTALTCLLILGGKSDVGVEDWAFSLSLLSPYFHRPYVDGVYWTLLIELKFYFCVLALIWLGWLRHYRVWLPAWLLTTICFRAIGQPFFMGWFISPEYSPCFIAGIVIFRATREGWQAFHWAMLSICLLLSGRYGFEAVDTFARDVTTVDRWVATGLIALLFVVFGLAVSLGAGGARRPIIGFLGGLTYPLYLLHDRIGKEVFAAIDRPRSPLARLSMVTCGVLLASAAVHLLVERRLADHAKAAVFDLLAKAQGRRSVGAPGKAEQD